MDGLRQRRDGALDALLATYGRQIQAVASLIAGSQADAEEILIDTMLTAWDKANDLRDPEALRAWLLRIASAAKWRRLGYAVVLRAIVKIPTRATATMALPCQRWPSISQAGRAVRRAGEMGRLES